MAPQNPLISVLIPSYNHEGYILHTLLSVLNQTFRNFELLVLDDGSTDKTFEIIQQVAKTDARVRCWTQSNEGVVASLNTLAAEAKGEFIAQLGSDDLWLPHRLEWGLQDFEANPGLSATFCSFLTVNNDLMSLKPVIPDHFRRLQGTELASHLVLNNYVGALTVLMRKSCLEQAGVFARDLVTCQDWDLWLRLSMQGPLNLRPQIGALYRWHGDNMSLKHQELAAKETLRVLRETSPQVLEHYNLGEQARQALGHRIAQAAMAAGEPEVTLNHLLDLTDTRPLNNVENVMLLYSLVLSKRFKEAHAVFGVLNDNKHHIEPHLQQDLMKIGKMMGVQAAHAPSIA